MNPELRQLIDHSVWEQGTLLAVAKLLPEDNAELAALIDETIDSSDYLAFCFVIVAALAVERRVAARHIARSAQLVPTHDLLGIIICHLQPDEQLPEILIEAVTTIMPQENQVVCLLLAAQHCVDHRAGIFPPELLIGARLLCKNTQLREYTRNVLISIAALTNDAQVRSLLVDTHASNPVVLDTLSTTGKGLAAVFFKIWRAPVLSSIKEKQDHWGPGGTVRRAVAKVGRNEPCPCGSGNKYKRCCEATDHDRLRQSSNVKGKTIAELRAAPEPHYTHETLKKAPAHELVRCDPTKLPRDLVGWFIVYLGAYGQHDKIVSTFEALGCPPDLEKAWAQATLFLVKGWRTDLAHRHLALRTDTPELRASLGPDFRLLLVGDDPATFLTVLQTETLGVLQSGNTREQADLAHALLCSPYSALGIHLCRSFIPFLPKTIAGDLHSRFVKTRIKLQLSGDDPVSDLLDRRYADEVQDQGKDAEELRQARARLDAKTAESRKLQAQIDHLRHELEHQEQLAQVPTTPAAPAPAPDPQIVKDLRAKVEALKGHLNEHHHERTALRRDLQKAYAELKEARQTQPPTTSHDTDPDAQEASHLLPGDLGTLAQPPRLIHFPPRFHDTLAQFPTHVSRTALTLLGRLAAGDSSAFGGVVRLHDLSGCCRIRIGSDHRLIFRLDPETLHIIDLINRRDLDKRLKSLRNSPSLP